MARTPRRMNAVRREPQRIRIFLALALALALPLSFGSGLPGGQAAQAAEVAPRQAPPAKKTPTAKSMPPAKAGAQGVQGPARAEVRVDPARLGDAAPADRAALAAWLEALARTLKEREAQAPGQAALCRFLEDQPGRPRDGDRSEAALPAEVWEGREALAALAGSAKALNATLTGRGREFESLLGRMHREREARPPEGLWPLAMDLDLLLDLDSQVRALLVSLLGRDMDARSRSLAAPQSSPSGEETAGHSAGAKAETVQAARELARRAAAFKAAGPAWTGPGGLVPWQESLGAARDACLADNARLLALDRELAAEVEALTGATAPDSGPPASAAAPGSGPSELAPERAREIGQARAFLAGRVLAGNARLAALDPSADLDRPVFLHLPPLSPDSGLQALERPLREPLEELARATGQRLALAGRVREALAAMDSGPLAADGQMAGGPGASSRPMGSCPEASASWPELRAQALAELDRAASQFGGPATGQTGGRATPAVFPPEAQVVADPVLAARAVDANRAMEALVRLGPCLLTAAAWRADAMAPGAAREEGVARVRALARELDQMAGSLGRDQTAFRKFRAACGRILNEAGPRFLEAARVLEARDGPQAPALAQALRQRQALVRDLKSAHFEAMMRPDGPEPCRACPALPGEWAEMDRAGPLAARALGQLAALAALTGGGSASASGAATDREGPGTTPIPAPALALEIPAAAQGPAARVLQAAPLPPGGGDALWPALALLAAHGPGCLRAWPLDPAPSGFWRGLGLDSPDPVRAAAAQAAKALDQGAKALQGQPGPRLAGLALWPPAGSCPAAAGLGRASEATEKSAAWLAATALSSAAAPKAQAAPGAKSLAAAAKPPAAPAPLSQALEAAATPAARDLEARSIQERRAPDARSIQEQKAPEARDIQEQKAPEAQSLQARSIREKGIEARSIESKDIDSEDIKEQEIKEKEIKEKEIKEKSIKEQSIKEQKLEKKEEPQAQELQEKEAPKAMTIEKQDAPPPVNW